MSFPSLFQEAPAKNMTPGELVASASVGEFVKSIALAVADAQSKLDDNSVKQALALAQNTIKVTGSDGNVAEKSLLELGFAPAFYHFTTVTFEIKLSMSLRISNEFGISLGGSAGNAISNPLLKDGVAASAKLKVLATDGTTFAVDLTVNGAKLSVQKGEKTFADLKTAAELAKALETFLNTDTSGAVLDKDKKAINTIVAFTSDESDLVITAKTAGKAGNDIKVTSSAPKDMVQEPVGGALDNGSDPVSPDAKPGDNAFVAWGVSLDANYHRRYDFDVSGSSSVTATMAAIAAPTAFVEHIKSGTVTT